MSKLDNLKGKQSSGPRPRPDHERIVQGLPQGGGEYQGCPGPVDIREWTPDLHEQYPHGPWEQRTALRPDGGPMRLWVHVEYAERSKQRRYCSLPQERLAPAPVDDDYQQRIEDAYGDRND